MTHIKVLKPQTGHDVVLTDPNIPPTWNPDFVEEMREVLDLVRQMREKKGDS